MPALLGAVALAALAAAGSPAAPGPGAGPERVTFEDAVRRAAGRAPAARIAADEVARAEALVAEARAGSLPALSATGTLTRLDAERRQGAVVVAEMHQRNATAALALPILSPGRWAQWSQASAAADVARLSEADARRQAVLAAARTYLAVLAQRRVVEVSRSALDLARARVEFARARQAGGVGNTVDQARAEQVLAANTALLENGYAGLARAQEALGIATGGDGPLDAAEEPSFPAPPDEPGLAAAESRRADVAVAGVRLELARKVERESWADWLPALALQAQGFLQDPPTIAVPRSGWQAQLVLSVPLLEGGLRWGQRAERAALAREADTARQAVGRQARSEVRVAREALTRSEAALQAARRAAGEARRVLELATEAYRAGATNSLDLTTAQQQSRDADLALVIGEDAARNARLDLLAAAGIFPP
ncbi:MAG TPA: TolC family protein [Anaeromyxobacteraceae bacterium]|jgi:outer membrane protein TolC